MLAYFDTSAFVPLLIAEPGSERARATWQTAARRVSSRLIVVETSAALGAARRVGRLDAGQLTDRRDVATDLLARLDLVELVPELAARAADASIEHGLRGYDAVHLASALVLAEDDLVVVAGDHALLHAARTAGLHTVAIT